MTHIIKKIEKEFYKFTVVGLLNFLFTLFSFFVLVEIIKINYLIALAVVSFFGMFLTYTLNYIWVFKLEEKIKFKGRLMRYIFAGFVSVGLNGAILKSLVDWTQFDPFWLQMALIPVVVIFNFSTAKYWTLREEINK